MFFVVLLVVKKSLRSYFKQSPDETQSNVVIQTFFGFYFHEMFTQMKEMQYAF